jgi:hypothetical protein
MKYPGDNFVAEVRAAGLWPLERKEPRTKAIGAADRYEGTCT